MQRAHPVKAVVVIGFALLIIGLPIVMLSVFFPRKEPTVAVQINGYKFRATVADTEEEREKGLSGTKSLRQGSGKIFVFPDSGYWGIWMKDMNYSLDILWLNDDKSIVNIKEQASPDSYPQVFNTRVPARYVIEIPSGTVSKNSIKLGDKAEFNSETKSSDL